MKIWPILNKLVTHIFGNFTRFHFSRFSVVKKNISFNSLTNYNHNEAPEGMVFFKSSREKIFHFR